MFFSFSERAFRLDTSLMSGVWAEVGPELSGCCHRNVKFLLGRKERVSAQGARKGDSTGRGDDAGCAVQGEVSNVRAAQELHQRAALYAEEHDLKLNAVVQLALEEYLTHAE
jgi:hypothetical protein